MYSFSNGSSFFLKNQVRESIFSLLGNAGKTLNAQSQVVYAEISLPWYQKLERAIRDIWVTPYKRIVSYLLILFSATLFSPSGTSFAASGETEKTFIVTAYYSPLPGQSFYLKGNYNAERRLNGNGTNGASGTPVFTGMIAAPKSYDFGTQIFFPGLGVGNVQDRGGAIVEAFERGHASDRIDIWMGQGESGLKRALLWGRREVTGIMMTGAASVANMNPIDLEGIDNGRVDLSQFKKVVSNAIGGISSDVIAAFADLGYVVENNDVKGMITEFQLDYGVIPSKEDAGAGIYGPKTRVALATAHAKFSNIQDEENAAIEAARKELLDERTAWEARYNQAQNSISAIGSPKIGDRGSNVALLQDALKNTGFFKGKSNGIMNGSTILALKKYQKSRGLTQTGKVDPATKTALAEDSIEA